MIPIDDICERLLEGMALKAVCKTPGYPTLTQLMRAMQDDHEVASKITMARANQSFTMRDELLEIADNDALRADERKVKIEVRKWLMGKENATRYGDFQRIELTGANGGPMEFLTKMSDKQLEAELARLEQRTKELETKP